MIPTIILKIYNDDKNQKKHFFINICLNSHKWILLDEPWQLPQMNHVTLNFNGFRGNDFYRVFRRHALDYGWIDRN